MKDKHKVRLNVNIRNIAILLSIVFSFVTLFGVGQESVISTVQAPLGVTNSTEIMIPMYVYPGSGANTPDYARLVSLAKKYPAVQLDVIVNPSNGPGTSAGSGYTAAFNALSQVPNIKLLGYVAAGYYMTPGRGNRTEASIKADILKWSQLYPQVKDGIFIDEMSWIGSYNSTFANFYLSLKDYCHTQGFPLVVSNPGCSIPAWYHEYKLADVICIHETSSFPSESDLISQGYGSKIDINEASILVFGSGVFNSSKFTMSTKYAKYVFCNDIPTADSDPWASLTTTLEQQIMLLNNTTTPPIEEPTIAPTKVPTKAPTIIPTKVPTRVPTVAPTKAPTRVPTAILTKTPTMVPTKRPTKVPTPTSPEIPHTYSIKIDGNTSDWSGISSIWSKDNGRIRTIKVAQDSSYIYISVEGQKFNQNSNYQIMLNTDNNDNTGYKTSEWGSSGIDYMVENGELHSYKGSGESWSWKKVTTVKSVKRNTVIELAIPLSNIESPSIFKLGVMLLNSDWDVIEYAPKNEEMITVNDSMIITPTKKPTKVPTTTPTSKPTKVPTITPTSKPTKVPTKAPTIAPTKRPTKAPTQLPTKVPTQIPTTVPAPSQSNILSFYKNYSNWYKGETHCHTVKSDGDNTIQEMLTAYKAKGYNFAFVTDHNTITSPNPSVSGLLWIPGEEVATNLGSQYPDANAFNVSKIIPEDTKIQAAIDSAISQGGFMQTNHPHRAGGTVNAADYNNLKNLWGIEITNYWNGDAIDLWDSQISQGKHIFATAGDDAHGKSDAGVTFVMVNSPDLSIQSITDNLKNGNFYCSEGPDMKISVDGNTITVSTTNGDSIRWYKEKQTLLKTTSGKSDSYTVNGNEVFVRAEVVNSKVLHGSTGKPVRAFSQPFFVQKSNIPPVTKTPTPTQKPTITPTPAPTQKPTATPTIVPSNGKAYYISTTGNDNNPGTIDSCWRTIQKACNTLKPGETAYIKAGTYKEKVKVNVSGTSNAYITIQNYGNDVVTLDGTGVSGSNIISINNKSYVRIKGLDISNNSGSNTPVGIFVDGYGSGIQIINNKVHGIKSNSNAHGIAVYATSGSQSINNLLIDGNEVYNCVLGSSESVVVNGNVENFIITNNRVHDNDNIGIDCIGFEGTAPSNDQARNGVVRGNTVYNITSKNNPAYKGSLGADGLYVDGGKNIVFENNTVYNCDIGIEVASEHLNKVSDNVIVRNNLIYNSYLYGICFGGASSSNGYAENCTFVNNTLYNNDTGINIQKSRNNKIENNIIYGSTSLRDGTVGSNTFNYNIWYSSNSSLKPSGLSATDKFINPMFADIAKRDFHLLSGSSAINGGNPNSTADIGAYDLDRNTRILDGRVDCGAFEYGL